ncbi:MAG: bifunctional phosphoribosylaminoimidazolecarboxamide formyltransferase/IMP cyclohydrolase [Proteobacteria bacterium]|nr:bifunctional phosphoribosylaminoimidazolecarboxamide formyltransferase/IMP cyclohydrolase [Pseudomonadota bacterium]
MSAEALTPIRRALISVSDKSGLADLGRFLAARGVEILSTGGSARALAEAEVAVIEVSAHTGFPEIMDGRVKTLHPKVHGGILARRDLASHRAALAEHGIAAIDLVVVNLYPFEATLASGADAATCIENIDIGGPAMLRAAAKNHDFVTVVTDPADYAALMEEMTAHQGATSQTLRARLATAAFAHTAAYDAAIAAWLQGRAGEALPARLVVSGTRRQVLRYGENPHQEAALYAAGPAQPGVASAEQLQGKELSYNNLNDTGAAFELVSEFQPPEFETPAVAIIKHANPCGVALGSTLAEAYARALACDPVSAFGGIIAVNGPLDGATAAAIAELFAEVVIAPGFEPEALAALAGKKNLRLLATGAMADPAAPGMTFKSLAGGILLQSRDSGRIGREDLKVVTKRAPSEAETADLLFAFRVAKHVKSNAIVYVRGGATVGVGAGQMSRIDSARIAALKAREAVQAAEAAGRDASALGTAGSVVASDAFFPFADGLLAAVEAGATAVIQPGGSVRDQEVIAAADEAGIAMVFTGMRHFRH